MKLCRSCNKPHPESAFGRSGGYLRSSCNMCRQMITKAKRVFKKECADNLAWSNLMRAWRVV